MYYYTGGHHITLNLLLIFITFQHLFDLLKKGVNMQNAFTSEFPFKGLFLIWIVDGRVK